MSPSRPSELVSDIGRPSAVLLPRQLLQGAPGRDGVRVVRAEDALADVGGAFQERAGGVQLTLVAEQGPETVEAVRGARVVGSPGSSADGQSPLEQRPGGIQLASDMEQAGQAIEADSGVGVVGPQGPLADGQGGLYEG